MGMVGAATAAAVTVVEAMGSVAVATAMAAAVRVAAAMGWVVAARAVVAVTAREAEAMAVAATAREEEAMAVQELWRRSWAGSSHRNQHRCMPGPRPHRSSLAQARRDPLSEWRPTRPSPRTLTSSPRPPT